MEIWYENGRNSFDKKKSFFLNQYSFEIKRDSIIFINLLNN